MNEERQNKKLIVIAGPTAVGKTDFAIKLASKLTTDIISADSRQVYQEMSIGTAKPTLVERKGIKHHFMCNVSIQTPYNVGTYEKEVIAFLNEYFKTKSTIILCGGTGMYIDAITKGLDSFPDVSIEIKEEIVSKYKIEGIEYLQNKLKELDPDYFEIVDINNPHRLIRALSVIEQTGKSFSSFLGKEKVKRDFDVEYILLDMPREILYDRINKRVDKMLEKGLEEEVLRLEPYKKLKALQTVGYQELYACFEGEISYDEAINLIKRNSRRYAKRQLTWFRNKGEWNIFNPNNIDLVFEYLKNKGVGKINE